jgi:hypothetical protein
MTKQQLRLLFVQGEDVAVCKIVSLSVHSGHFYTLLLQFPRQTTCKNNHT